jgi:hypothetical protein
MHRASPRPSPTWRVFLTTHARDIVAIDFFVVPTITNMGIREVIIAPRTPWQNAFVERVIGSIRRECLDHVIVLSEAPLGRVLRADLAYYNTARPHQSLDNNSPQPREVHPPELGRVVSIPQVGGLHHRSPGGGLITATATPFGLLPPRSRRRPAPLAALHIVVAASVRRRLNPAWSHRDTDR